MGRLILLVLAATLAAPATAHACTALPAGFAEDVRVTASSRAGLPVDVTRTSVCVRAAGRRLVLATGRDLVAAQPLAGIDGNEWLRVVGLDRHWVVVQRGSVLRAGDSCQSTQEAIDGRSGRIPRQTVAPCDGPPLATEGAPLAVTSRGVASWVSDEGAARRLLTAGPDERVVELDRGAIEGLRARGAAVEWTRDGAPRSMELP